LTFPAGQASSRADAESGLVTVRSGTTLRALNAALDVLGLAMPNLGDIDVQTIVGAISTGTHGTGARGPGGRRRRYLTAYGRDTAYVAIHQYKGLPYQEYFRLFEPALRRLPPGPRGDGPAAPVRQSLPGAGTRPLTGHRPYLRITP
jgi:hypothetical protein